MKNWARKRFVKLFYRKTYKISLLIQCFKSFKMIWVRFLGNCELLCLLYHQIIFSFFLLKVSGL